MARARNSGPALHVSRRAEYDEIIAWYRDRLAATAPPAGLAWEPVKIGPTWQWDNGWVLPERTLGWDRLAWCGYWLRGKGRKPWVFTPEQARFVLWYDAVDEDGENVFHSAALQRLKGHGKDPLAATIAASSLHADIVFDRWDGDRPVGRDEPDAWTQVLGVSQDQTKNTMKLFPSLISPEARLHYGIQIGKLNVWSDGDRRQIEAITASVMAVEGGRPKQVICNEIQNWNSSNSGHDMVGAIRGNAAKAEEGAPARILYIFNAYRPGEDSVAQRIREGWEKAEAGQHAEYGLMYDSLEAPPEAPLTLDAAPAVVESIRGDSDWLQVKRILKDIADPNNPPSESRRKWYNQITAAEDDYTTPQLWDVLADPGRVLTKRDEVAVGLDCSKSDDATFLVAARISDGHTVTLGMWQKPPAERGKGWLAPRDLVDHAVNEAFSTLDVVAMFGDPSHALDDETMERYWDGLFDSWHRRYSKRLKVWARSGKTGHSVMYDLSIADNHRRYVEQVQLTEEEIEQKAFTHDGDARLRTHMLNAKRLPTRHGMSIGKEHRESTRKMDGASALNLARLARRLYLNQGIKKGGQVW